MKINGKEYKEPMTTADKIMMWVLIGLAVHGLGYHGMKFLLWLLG